MKVLLKRGEHGSAVFFRNEQGDLQEISKSAFDFADYPELKLIDTTGAGDCFTGAFATQMLEDVPLD